MKDYLKQQIENVRDPHHARYVVREYLQARTLECLQDSGAFVTWAFLGGTALRFLYSVPRFSEDLGFSTIGPGTEDRFFPLMEKVKSRFAAEGYDVTVKIKSGKAVKAAFIKFSGLLYELGLSPLPSEVISIKTEIDTNPPDGALLETSIVRRHVLLHLQHYDKSSLLAGKLHALLTRRYTKGRDIYDLLWYLSDRTWPGPNLGLLNNALRQTGWTGGEVTESNWRERVGIRMTQLDWPTAVADVKPFLEKKSDIQMLTAQNLIKLLQESAG